MYKIGTPLLDCLTGQKPERKPVWLMRQAGRYLPEYRALRSKAPDFISFCLTPTLAAEVTLQPLQRFDLDAAILFADILLIPFALGQKIVFKEGEGPQLNPVTEEKDILSLCWEERKIEPVFETIDRVKKELKPHHSLIGFAGGLWTVACYMIEGRGGFFSTPCRWAQEKPQELEKLLALLEEATLAYLSSQIEAGAQIIQFFESHAGLLAGDVFDRYVTEPTRRLVAALKNKHPSVPIIGFPRGAKEEDYENYLQKTGIDALGLDQHVSVTAAERKWKGRTVLQGNMDPAVLLAGGEAMKNEALRICEKLGPRHIFNLGHGVMKETPPEYVGDLVDFVHSLKVGA